MDDPIRQATRGPVSAIREALADLGLDGRSRPGLVGLARYVAAIAIPVFIIALLRPFDVTILSQPVQVYVVGIIGFVSLAVAGINPDWPRSVRAVAIAVGCVGAALILSLIVITSVLGNQRTPAASVALPQTDTTITLLQSNSGFGSNQVVVQGQLGPLPRSRVLLNLESCSAAITPAGPRAVEVSVSAMSGECDPPVGIYTVTLQDDGWSTSMTRMPNR